MTIESTKRNVRNQCERLSTVYGVKCELIWFGKNTHGIQIGAQDNPKKIQIFCNDNIRYTSGQLEGLLSYEWYNNKIKELKE